MRRARGRSARTEIERVLHDDPFNNLALDVYCKVLREVGEWSLVESVAKKRLERDAQCISAYVNLLLCHAVAGRRIEARGLHRRYMAIVGNPEGLETLNEIYGLYFGDRAATLSSMSEASAAAGDHRTAFGLSATAASARGDFWAALQDAELARSTGDNSASNLARMSLLSVRLMRFSKCREFARLALLADPRMPVPKELLFLARLSYFPPFWLANAIIYSAALSGRFKSSRVDFFLSIFCLMAMIPMVVMVANIFGVFGVPVYVTMGLTLAYLCYTAVYLGDIAGWFLPAVSKPIKLKDY